MASRICPKCNSSLHQSDRYFCSSCGEKLPQELINVPSPIRVKDYYALQPLFSFKRIVDSLKKPKDDAENLEQKSAEQIDEDIIRKSKNIEFKRQMGMILAVVFIILSVLFVGLYFFVNIESQNSPENIENNSQTYVNTMFMDLQLVENNFESKLIGFVPFDALVYIEGTDLHSIVSNYVDANTLKLSPGLFLEIPELFEKEFVAFAVQYNEKPEWFIVLTPVNSVEMAQLSQELDHDYLRFKMIDDRLVISTHGDSFEIVEAVKNKQALSLSQNPQYVRAKTKVSPIGSLLVIFQEELGREVLRDTAQQNVGSDVFTVLTDIVEANHQELVIRKQN